MGLCGVTNEIKEDFGRRLRAARDAKGLSRQVLSARLGVSPKTVQSWEMGRTFIEKLSLFPLIERELGISLSEIIEEAMLQKSGKSTKKAAESRAKYGKKSAPVADVNDTEPVTFAFTQVRTNADINPEINENFYAIPIVKPSSLAKPVFDLKESDVIDHTIISKEWVPRGGVMIACTNSDTGLEPTVPADALIIIDRRELIPEKNIGRNVAVIQKGKGLKLRKLEEGTKPGSLRGAPAGGKARGSFEIKQDKGDIILGRIIAVFAKY